MHMCMYLYMYMYMYMYMYSENKFFRVGPKFVPGET